MRLSELLGSPVVDPGGTPIGVVRDLRLRIGADGDWRVTGIVLGDAGLLSAAAHSSGFVDGRAVGPALLRMLFSGAVRRARFIPAERVSDWGPGEIVIRGSSRDLPSLAETGL